MANPRPALLSLLLLGLSTAVAPPAGAEATLPAAPASAIHDEANVLGERTRRALESLLVEHDRLTDEQVVLALVRTDETVELDARTRALFDHWQVGQRGRGQGLLLVLDDRRREAAFRAGYGLNPALDPNRLREILGERALPALRRDDAPRAMIETAVEALRALGSPLVETGELEAILQDLPARPPLEDDTSERAPPYGLWLLALAAGLGLAWTALGFVIGADAHYTATGWTRPRPFELARRLHAARRSAAEMVAALGGTHGRW
jgi:uncharacterized membrane protein YgcG